MKDFVGFDSIERIQQPITITEKIHGSNAQILIDGSDIYAGSRTRWITPDDDNYNFAKWVNAGYDMKTKRFVLFNTHRWIPVRDEGGLPEGVDVVPVLYAGPFTATIIDTTMDALRASGSMLVPGYMKPEGVVIRFDRSKVLMKRTFESEDEAWNYKKDRPPSPDRSEVEALCAPFWQPLRLEKLLSRDEAFGRDYPSSLPALVSAYVHDLFDETDAVDEATQKLVKKNAFKAIKGMMSERGYAA